jgi:hypothetical protein
MSPDMLPTPGAFLVVYMFYPTADRSVDTLESDYEVFPFHDALSRAEAYALSAARYQRLLDDTATYSANLCVTLDSTDY